MPSRSAVAPRSVKPSQSAEHLRLVPPPASAATVALASAGGPKPLALQPRPAPPRAFGDWLWNGLGVGAATASAGFATYALVFSTGQVVPSGNFNLFARYDHLYKDSGRPLSTPAPDRTTVAAAIDAVDFTPTGSVGEPDPAGDERAPPVAARARRGVEGPALSNFTLRDVFDGKALVESHASLSVVKPGSMLDGAGEVLSIEKRGERWVVLTENGVIAGQRR